VSVLGFRSHSTDRRTDAPAVRKLPLGVGLTIGALLSGGLWVAAVLAVKALLF
jgi:hypothetical protein